MVYDLVHSLMIFFCPGRLFSDIPDQKVEAMQLIWSQLKSKKSISYLLRSLKRHWCSSRSVDVYSNPPSSISHTSWTTCCHSLASPHNSCTPSACTCSQPGLAITCHLLITCHLPITCPRENIFSLQRFLHFASQSVCGLLDFNWLPTTQKKIAFLCLAIIKSDAPNWCFNISRGFLFLCEICWKGSFMLVTFGVSARC